MKKIALFSYMLFVSALAFAQEIKVDDEDIKFEKKVIATVDKEKDGRFSIPRFTLLNSSGTVLAKMGHYTYSNKAGQLLETIYTVSFPSFNDSIQFTYNQFSDIQKIPLFGAKDETYAKFFVKSGLITKDGTIDQEVFAKLKKQFPEDHAAKYAAARAAEEKCATALATLVARDKTKPVTVTEVKREETTPGKMVTITYEIKQADVLIGTVTATGNPAVAKDARAEIDYSPGIASLDGDDTPMNYTFNNNGGCTAATYSGTGRTITTNKDNQSKAMKVILGKRFTEIQSRNDLIKEGAAYLAANGYL